MAQCVFDASWLYYYIQLSKQFLRSMFDMSSYRGYLRRAYGIMLDANTKEAAKRLPGHNKRRRRGKDDHNKSQKNVASSNRRFFLTSPLDSLFGYKKEKERCQFMSYHQYQQGYQGFQGPGIAALPPSLG